MTIVVVGAGAIGLLTAGRLAQAGHRTVLLARPRVAAAMAQERLHILQGGALLAIDELITIADPSSLAEQDRHPELAILCVKGYDTAAALPTLEALGPRSVLTLQNGIGNEEILAGRFGVEYIIGGAITASVEVVGPCRIAVAKDGGIGIAPMSPVAAEGAGHAAGLLRDAAFEVREFADYRALKWSKALLNMLGNATAAILDMPVTDVYADRRLVELERRAFLEALATMSSMGCAPVNLPRYPVAQLAWMMRRMPAWPRQELLRRLIAGGRGGKTPSLLLELARGNPRSEGAFLYGAIARAAAQHGIDAPVNRALYEILQGIAGGAIVWDTYRRQPERLLEAVERRPMLAD
jgi:2-dehydropantoate 2-reductase